MSEASSSGALHDALCKLSRSAYDATSPAMAPLRENVCAVVDDLKARGMKPEHVVLALKGIAENAGITAGRWRLLETMIRWSLEHYFREAVTVDAAGKAKQFVPAF